LDLSGVKVVGDDFNQTALAEEMVKEATLQRICLITKEEMEGQTVVFTAGVAPAKGVCHYMNHNYGIPAVFVHGKQDEDERREALRRFKSREVQVLVNCQVVAVGFDYPPTATLILGRPTRSRSFWLQCVGRATRPLPGTVDFPGSTAELRRQRIVESPKPHFKIVDCTDASLDHRLVTAVDMFLQAGPEVKKEVKRQAAEAKAPLTPEQLAELAAEEEAKRKLALEIEARRAATRGQATGTIRRREFDLESGRRCVGTYFNPLKGKYAGLKMSELTNGYIHWACRDLREGWVKNLFRKERDRRERARLGR
jgi:superfamily II DNA or RNA helicase